jgi:hypothetical protein
MKPKPLVALNHLTVPVVMFEPFHSILNDRNAESIADGDSDF